MYVFSDYFSASIAWVLFVFNFETGMRLFQLGKLNFLGAQTALFFGLLIIPLFWLLISYLNGYYAVLVGKSRLQELWNTFYLTLVASMVLFLVGFLLVPELNPKLWFGVMPAFMLVYFFSVYIPRVSISSIITHRIRTGKMGYNTLLIGSYGSALQLYNELEQQPKKVGYKFVGFVHVKGNKNELLTPYLEHLGGVENLPQLIRTKNIEEVIIAVETSEHNKIQGILNILKPTPVRIKAIPSTYDIINGRANISTLYSPPLIEVTHELMSIFELNFKRLFDITASVFAMALLLPVYLFVAGGVLFSSRGPIFYYQERIGLHGKPFMIYKFRSMLTGAEKDGPALSSIYDSRVTKFGRIMRRFRLDELPQFYNVIKGEMSIVGPRPERQCYINQIVERAPHYKQLHRVKPGLTSWGQVKFGYAENVDEMIERLKFDLIYIENMSLYVDFKIIIYTVKVILDGRGR